MNINHELIKEEQGRTALNTFLLLTGTNPLKTKIIKEEPQYKQTEEEILNQIFNREIKGVIKRK